MLFRILAAILLFACALPPESGAVNCRDGCACTAQGVIIKCGAGVEATNSPAANPTPAPPGAPPPPDLLRRPAAPRRPPPPGEPQPGDPMHADDLGHAPPSDGVPLGPLAPEKAQDDDGAAATAREEAVSLLGGARASLSRGDFAGAARAASRSLELYPKNPGALSLRAQAYNLLGHHRQAEKDALASLALSPGAAAYQNLAWAQLRQGRPQEALESSRKAIELNSKDGLTYAIRAYIEESLKNREGVLWNIRRAAELNRAFDKARDAAEAGGLIYDPNADSSALLAAALSVQAARQNGFPWKKLLSVLLAAGGVLGGLLLLGRRRRATGSWRAALTPLPSIPLTTRGDGWVGKYELGKVIGRGGMGVVYEALDHTLGRTVAVKRMTDTLGGLGEKSRESYIKEARTVASLHHPGIVDIYDVVEQDRDVYLVFEFVRGKTAHQLLTEQGRLPLPKAVALMRQVCPALEFAHRKSLVHRDLKPMNIMVTEEGQAKLMDFGIARLLEGPDGRPDVARTQTVLGTPVYMAPECWQGVVRKESDIYSLGVCLYELLTGSLPFSDPLAGRERFVPAGLKAAGLPPAIDRLLSDALEPDPRKRIKTAKEFLARLEAAAGPGA